MIRLENLTCARCGADIPVPPADASSVRCQCCGHTAQVERPVVAPPAPPLERAFPRVQPSETSPAAPSSTAPAAQEVLSQGTDSIAVGVKAPGTGTPIAVGFDAMALEAKTGAAIWDVPVANTADVAEAEDVIITPTRVYLPHWVWLDVLDVRTGGHIATFGAW